MVTVSSDARPTMEKAMQKEIEDKKKRIKAAFELFDKEKKECVIQE